MTFHGLSIGQVFRVEGESTTPVNNWAKTGHNSAIRVWKNGRDWQACTPATPTRRTFGKDDMSVEVTVQKGTYGSRLVTEPKTSDGSGAVA